MKNLGFYILVFVSFYFNKSSYGERVAHLYKYDEFLDFTDVDQETCVVYCKTNCKTDTVRGEEAALNCDCENYPSFMKINSTFWIKYLKMKKIEIGHFSEQHGSGPKINKNYHPSHFRICNPYCNKSNIQCEYSKIDLEKCSNCANLIRGPLDEECDCQNKPSFLKKNGVWWNRAVREKTIGFY